MRAEIEILHSGLLSTIQDQGRFGYRKFGVPVSGAMDKYAAQLANVILQNSPDCAVIEITQMGPKLKFSGKAQIVVTGANLSPKINSREIQNNIVFFIEAGDILSFGTRTSGCRSYIGIAGGINCDVVLGSKSWYQGITVNSTLIKGMNLNFTSSSSKPLKTFSSVKPNLGYLNQFEILVKPGPEFDKLIPGLQKQLFNRDLFVSKNNNRMALQLEGFDENAVKPIITGPVIPGTVQLTPGGNLIVLGCDGQTTGGYPRVLQVTKKGMDTLSQKVLGNIVNFKME